MIQSIDQNKVVWEAVSLSYTVHHNRHEKIITTTVSCWLKVQWYFKILYWKWIYCRFGSAKIDNVLVWIRNNVFLPKGPFTCLHLWQQRTSSSCWTRSARNWGRHRGSRVLDSNSGNRGSRSSHACRTQASTASNTYKQQKRSDFLIKENTQNYETMKMCDLHPSFSTILFLSLYVSH